MRRGNQGSPLKIERIIFYCLFFINNKMTVLEEHPHKIIVCAGGRAFKVARAFASNTWTFVYYNKENITTLDVIIRQQEAMKRQLKEVKNKE